MAERSVPINRPTISAHAGSRPSADVQTMMTFEANKKSVGVAYLLWFFLGGFGAHRFYLGQTGTALAMLILFVLGWLTIVVFVGTILLIAVGIWMIVDAFLIPGLVRDQNSRLAQSLGAATFR